MLLPESVPNRVYDGNRAAASAQVLRQHPIRSSQP